MLQSEEDACLNFAGQAPADHSQGVDASVQHGYSMHGYSMITVVCPALSEQDTRVSHATLAHTTALVHDHSNARAAPYRHFLRRLFTSGPNIWTGASAIGFSTNMGYLMRAFQVVSAAAGV